MADFSAIESRIKQQQRNVEACKNNLANARAQKASKGQIDNLKTQLKHSQDFLKQLKEELKQAKARR